MKKKIMVTLQAMKRLISIIILLFLVGNSFAKNADFLGAREVVAAKGGLQYSDDLLKAAQQAYPKLAGKTQLHHITPKYLGGPANGPLIKLDAAYHQQITNAFRQIAPYGSPKPSPARLAEIMNEVYSKFPLPK